MSTKVISKPEWWGSQELGAPFLCPTSGAGDYLPVICHLAPCAAAAGNGGWTPIQSSFSGTDSSQTGKPQTPLGRGMGTLSSILVLKAFLPNSRT